MRKTSDKNRISNFRWWIFNIKQKSRWLSSQRVKASSFLKLKINHKKVHMLMTEYANRVCERERENKINRLFKCPVSENFGKLLATKCWICLDATVSSVSDVKLMSLVHRAAAVNVTETKWEREYARWCDIDGICRGGNDWRIILKWESSCKVLQL